MDSQSENEMIEIRSMRLEQEDVVEIASSGCEQEVALVLEVEEVQVIE